MKMDHQAPGPGKNKVIPTKSGGKRQKREEKSERVSLNSKNRRITNMIERGGRKREEEGIEKEGLSE